ncbi:hypothetical protein [Azovibrio restrictus]|uniref:hypothetical protein n=1 Tax=Azovibrio restrictus TaxID=146938 RepID=UPI0026EAE64D|nr:hypothetical protein [Azovibrio restrictus]
MKLLPASALQQWEKWAARFQAMTRRERLMIATALVGGVAYLGVVLWVEPTFARARQQEKQAAAQAAELAGLQAQIQALGQQVARDPDLPLRQNMAALEEQMAGLDQRMDAFKGSLVAPGEAAVLLGDLVRRHPGVRVAGFTTLPPAGLLAGRDAAGAGAAAQVASPSASRILDVYQHGFELKLRGNYLDLLAYLKVLEAQPKQLLWHRATLVVREYPESELTLHVYTLSLDKHWLSL